VIEGIIPVIIKYYLDLLIQVLIRVLIGSTRRASPNPTTSTNKWRYDDTVDLEDPYDEPLFLTRPLDPTLLASSSLLASSATRGLESHEIADRSDQIKRRRF
jgi:hypothetical protein